VREAVHQLKYRDVRVMAPVLDSAMAERMLPRAGDFDVVAAVPLHRSRLRERGFNQADLLAREVSGRLGTPLERRAVVPSGAGPFQAKSAGVEERLAAVSEAFVHRARLDGMRVLLVDDVCTTGATLEACAGALKAGGAAMVWGLTFAREL